YLDALAKPRIAQVKRDAQIAQAEADRDAMIKSSQATQAGQEAKFAADSKIAEAQRDYQSNVAGYQATVNLKKAEADLAYDLQKFKTGQLVKAEEVQVQIIEKQKQIELQQQEIRRKQRELEAMVQKRADAERYKVETLANAKKFQLETEGGGASKLTGDVAQIISQLPPVLESLTGVKFEKLLEQVPALKKAMGKSDDKQS